MMKKTVNELSLFSGIGGGCIASMMLGHRIIGYVEKDEYCQKILRARIDDELLSNAPIFGDIRAFIDNGCCELYRGITDIVSGGFPCQPFSVAGKREAEKDDRNMWPATCEVIKRIAPLYVFLENVPGLVSSGYFGVILQNFSEIGYDARWMHLSASDCKAPHKRERLWILAYSKKIYDRLCDSDKNKGQKSESGKCNGEGVFSDTDREQAKRIAESWKECDSWRDEPGLDRVAYGVPDRVQRTKALGNAQVPIVAATAFKTLMESVYARSDRDSA